MLEHYRNHLNELANRYESALETAAKSGDKYNGIVFHAGTQTHYHADDREIPFVRTPHFARICPLLGTGHLIVFAPGKDFRLIRVVAPDFWYEPAPQVDHPFPELLSMETVESQQAAIDAAGDCAGYAFVGADSAVAKALGVTAIEPTRLMALLDWDRAYKTPYEAECVREATRRASEGHAAVRAGVEKGLSERELHAAYLDATGLLENQTPYTNIIGWDDHAAVLHYQSKEARAPQLGHSFLIDAGADCFGYASDITRTYVREGVHPTFSAALDGMERLQRELVEAVGPGVDFVELHAKAHRGVAKLLSELKIVKCSADEAYDRLLTDAFLPHGLGHHLGIQVHDVGGHQSEPTGGTVAPPERFPFLRTTRRLEPGHLVTIEPGFYFIPMLLEPLREGGPAADLDWNLIDALTPHGGIRIEDNILVTENGQEDLSRPFIPGHRG